MPLAFTEKIVLDILTSAQSKNQKTLKIGQEIDEIHKFVFVNFLKCTDVHLLFVKPTIIKKNSRGQMLVLVSSLLDCENLMTRGLMAFMETSKVTCLSRFTLKSCVEVKYPNDHVCASTNEVWKELNVYEAWVRICQVVFKKTERCECGVCKD